MASQQSLPCKEHSPGEQPKKPHPRECARLPGTEMLTPAWNGKAREWKPLVLPVLQLGHLILPFLPQRPLNTPGAMSCRRSHISGGGLTLRRWNFLPSLCKLQRDIVTAKRVSSLSRFPQMLTFFFLPTEMKTDLKQSVFPFSPPEGASAQGPRQVRV